MRILLLAFALVSVTGCLEPEDDQVQLAEDFEGCGGCTWTFTGEVSIVTTNHPGEHAARLGAGAVIAHPLQIERYVDGDDYGTESQDFTDGNWIEYSTDCGGRPGLRLDYAGNDLFIRVRLEAPPDQAFGRRKLMLPKLPIGPIDPTPEDPYDEENNVPVVFRELTIESGAPCRIDNIRLMVSGGTLAY